MDPLKTMAKGSILILIGIIVSKLLGYIYRLIIARIGPESYGLFSLGLAIISALVILSVAGLDFGVLRYVAYYCGKNDKGKCVKVIRSAIVLSLSLSIIIGLLLFLFSGLISIKLFNNPGLIMVLKLFALSIPAYVLSKIFLSVLKSFKKVGYWVFSEYFVENSIKILLTLLFVFVFNLNLFGAILAFISSIYAVMILSFYFSKFKVINFIETNIKSTYNKMELINYSWPLMLSSLLGYAILTIDTLMIGYLLKDAILVGIYNVAVPTALLILIVPQALLGIFIPVMSELLAKKDKDKMNTSYKTVTRWIFFVNLPLCLLLSLFSKEVVNIFFGKIYLEANIPLIILAFGYLLYSVSLASRYMLEVIKKTKLVLANSIITIICNIILNYILVLKYGIIGGAIATCSSLVLLSLLAITETYYYIKIQPITFDYIKYIIGGALTSLIIYKISKNFSLKFSYLLILGLLFLTIYVGIIYLTKGIKKEDFELTKELFGF